MKRDEAMLTGWEAPTVENKTAVTSTLTEEDAALVDAIRRGDEAAFEQLVHRHTPMLYRVVRRMTADDLEAEDILQETFFRFWQKLAGYRNDRPLFPFLVTIAANLARDRWRRDGRLRAELPEEQETTQEVANPLPEDSLLHAETLQALAAAVERLPAPYRAVIALRYDAEMDYQDIAAALGLPVNTVRTHLRRAKARLRRVLEESDHE